MALNLTIEVTPLYIAPGQECVMRVVEGVFQIRVLSLDSTDGKT